MPYYYNHILDNDETDKNLLLYSKLNDIQINNIEKFIPIFHCDLTEYKQIKYVPIITDKFCAITYFERFFAKRFNKLDFIFEIPESDYNSINNKESFYKVTKLRWKISTTEKEVKAHNIMVNNAIINNNITTYKELIDTSKEDYKKSYVKLLNYNTLVMVNKIFPGIKKLLGNRLAQFYKEISLQDIKNILL